MALRCTKLVNKLWPEYINTPSDTIETKQELFFLSNSILNRVSITNGELWENHQWGDISGIIDTKSKNGLGLNKAEFCMWLYQSFGDTHALQLVYWPIFRNRCWLSPLNLLSLACTRILVIILSSCQVSRGCVVAVTVMVYFVLE